MTIEQYQEIVDSWITTTGKGYFSPLTNTAILAEETGEVARVMARSFGDQVAKDSDNTDLADELADVVWVVAAIANQTGIDLTEAIKNNIAKKNNRDKERFNL
ncbi:MAG: nucleotide pyrophosphohydrolase [Clostridiales bacterium]|nr:nucleotide pyrophosphohydrolase [Clostridiales bacterium]